MDLGGFCLVLFVSLLVVLLVGFGCFVFLYMVFNGITIVEVGWAVWVYVCVGWCGWVVCLLRLFWCCCCLVFVGLHALLLDV